MLLNSNSSEVVNPASSLKRVSVIKYKLQRYVPSEAIINFLIKHHHHHPISFHQLLHIWKQLALEMHTIKPCMVQLFALISQLSLFNRTPRSAPTCFCTILSLIGDRKMDLSIVKVMKTPDPAASSVLSRTSLIFCSYFWKEPSVDLKYLYRTFTFAKNKIFELFVFFH